MSTDEQLAMIKSIPNKSERGGNIFDFVGMVKQVTVKREQGMNQDVSSLDYINKVPKSKKTIKTITETPEWSESKTASY